VAADALRGWFVTGTDTGVGKTVVAAAMLARLRQDGFAVRAFKPLITGLDEPPDTDWPPDHELLARAAGGTPSDVVLVGYGPPVSPHLAAELAGQPVPSPADLAQRVRASAASGPGTDADAGTGTGTGTGEVITVVEGVGGLLVPLGPGADVRALARAVGLPLVIVARPALGTINHTLLTVEAARSAGLVIAGVVLTPWPEQPSVMERSNLETITRWGAVEVATLGFIAAPEPDLLAAAATLLPLRRWLSAPR
jgi:dethiobiotin synthetase